MHYTNEEIQKLKKVILANCRPEMLRPAGCNGGDGVHYHLRVGGNDWGVGEVFVRFTNHGYIKSQKDFNPYDDSIKLSVY